MNSLKARAREAMPPQLREVLRYFRRALDPIPIETRVIRPNTFKADPDEKPRLTLILPSLSKKKAFGGVTTTRDFFFELTAAVNRDLPLDVRIIVEDPYDPEDSILADTTGITIESLQSTNRSISTRKRDLFLVYNWWIALNLDPVLEAQAAHFSQPILTKFYIFQEYEPNFYPFSSANIMATAAINAKNPQNIIFNTKELLDYYHALNNRCDRHYVLEPVLSPAIRPFLDRLSSTEKERIILVYGRRNIDRNCFSILEEGLKAFAKQMPENKSVEDGGWTVCSAGLKHRDIPLGNGFTLKSLGKLSLDDYGALLCRSAVGVSLMASPHPSYPPLEMAHFGMRTITNNYANKDMTKRHENLLPLEQALPADLGNTLAETCRTFEETPELGLKAQTHMPSFIEGGNFSCLEDVAQDFRNILAQ
ncbi:hypothetical protein [uncultured Roseibium sp.]|uniref:rhamnosyltransferase WsaF family glycosyltransferase n=1 Tax=uncultured Roseibium sp. TaxID=1936171 RepID=UPI00262D85DA|nr:hypothetical protein [uncultured Roseibium sp.]